eukprot:jgi/Mesvir1/5318/Mv15410-RA.1
MGSQRRRKPLPPHAFPPDQATTTATDADARPAPAFSFPAHDEGTLLVRTIPGSLVTPAAELLAACFAESMGMGWAHGYLERLIREYLLDRTKRTATGSVFLVGMYLTPQELILAKAASSAAASSEGGARPNTTTTTTTNNNNNLSSDLHGGAGMAASSGLGMDTATGARVEGATREGAASATSSAGTGGVTGASVAPVPPSAVDDGVAVPSPMTDWAFQNDQGEFAALLARSPFGGRPRPDHQVAEGSSRDDAGDEDVPPGVLVGTVEIYKTPSAQELFTLAPPPGTVYLCNMAVDPRFRRKGLGKSLLEAAERAAVEVFGCSEIYLHSRVVDKPARGLYEGANYKVIGVDNALGSFFLGKQRRLLMRKNLRGAFPAAPTATE